VEATLDHARAALAAARGAGLAVERAEVAKVASNVLVRLEPGPFAARLTGATEGFRDSAANLRREARLAAAWPAAGAPVPPRSAAPTRPAGAASRCGRGSSCAAMPATPAGRAAPCAPATTRSPPRPGRPGARAAGDADRGAAPGVHALPELLPAIDRALATLGAAPLRIVHGDSHPGNVLWTAEGPLWGDWEDAHLAPLEWDLGCLVAAARMHGNDFAWAQAALLAHGRSVRRGLLEACVDARVAQGAAYLAATGRGDVSGPSGVVA
jgi:aminoglycoside phosphotransferase (APT) family kinase protein